MTDTFLNRSSTIYLGLLEISSGNAMIIDPYINHISTLMEKISPAAMLSQRVTRVRNGAYSAYIENSNFQKHLLVLHDSYDIADLGALSAENSGAVNCSLGKSVCVCDEDYLYNTSSCLYADQLLDEAFYSCERLKALLPDENLDNMTNHKLSILVGNTTDAYITGNEIKGALGHVSNLSLLPKLNENSTLWSCEVLRRVNSSLTGSAFLRGCVAVAVPAVVHSLQPVSIYRNQRHQVVGFRIRIN